MITNIVAAVLAAGALEASFDQDYASAYVYRGTILSDRPVWQPCVWTDYAIGPAYFGGWVWQNWDLDGRMNRTSGLRHGLNETDYNLHVGLTPWATEDQSYALTFETGHIWC